MRHLVPLLIVLFSTLVSYGQPPMTITDKGYFLTYINEQGVPTFVQVSNITDMRQGTTPLPPEKPREPEVDKAVVEHSKNWATAENDTDGVQALALTYINVMQAVDEGKISPDNAWKVLKLSTDKALTILGKPTKFVNYRAKVSDLTADLSSKGQLSTNKQVATLIRSLEYGLELAADGATALDNSKQIQIITSTNGVIDDYR